MDYEHIPTISTVSTIATWFACLSLPGMILSIIGLFGDRRKLASWGVLLGLVGISYLPTLFLTFSR